VTRQRVQPRAIGALLVLVTSLALLPVLHAHLAGAAEPGRIALAASGSAGGARHVGPACLLCQASSQARFATEVARVALPAAPAFSSRGLPAAEQPIVPGAPPRRGAPPRAPPALLA